MTKEELTSKPKKVKKLKKKEETGSEAKGQEPVEPDTESYVAGEIAGSLFPKKSTQTSSALSSLFGTKTCAVQPLYVPVVAVKRKPPEEEAKQSNKTTATSAPPEKKAKVSKKNLTVAEKKVADRESCLANADEAEETKNAKDKSNRKNIDDEDELPPQIKKKINQAEQRVKNKRTIFVGNLPVSCTKKMLMACFKEFGVIESMRFRSMAREDGKLSKKAATIQRKVHPKRHNINAYVVFEDKESVAKALARNGTEISSGFHIRVDSASNSSVHDNKRTTFVGNLPYEIEEETVRNHFSQCGTVEAVRIIRDNKTGIGKGFGYVLFKGTDSVQLALKLNNSELMGRTIRVKRCESQSTQKNTTSKQKTPHMTQNKSFMGETADVNKTKNKGPQNWPKNKPTNKQKDKAKYRPMNKQKDRPMHKAKNKPMNKQKDRPKHNANKPIHNPKKVMNKKKMK